MEQLDKINVPHVVEQKKDGGLDVKDTTLTKMSDVLDGCDHSDEYLETWDYDDHPNNDEKQTFIEDGYLYEWLEPRDGYIGFAIWIKESPIGVCELTVSESTSFFSYGDSRESAMDLLYEMLDGCKSQLNLSDEVFTEPLIQERNFVRSILMES